MFCVFSVCNQACKRGNKCTCSAYINSHKQGGVIVGKLGEKHSRGHVADKLAGKNTYKESILAHKRRENVFYNFNAT